MPPPRKEGRPEPLDAPPLGAKAVIDAVEAIPLVKKLSGARVLYKRNAKGEHVVAVVWPVQRF